MAHNMGRLIFIKFEYLSVWAPKFPFNSQITYKWANNDKGPKYYRSFYDIFS
jgi:hypothetical protein